ncbi:class I SAM-dependent methyltransferase [Microlunatus parietis]|uniref:SAM-dependent methyltransferase n=1 Tax=Microlunatus parietis TaxID=682979 RepID=A0A7Y9I7C5_9ACTN|nr:class I SAM-dependent methyltransferase [Microlunatus parietis]NYE71517.1 SAM-dependent methyltransferase [Microlunatus parietis]
MTDDLRAERETQLRTFYAKEVTTRAARVYAGRRDELRAEFIELLGTEQRSDLLEVGCGAGQDGSAFAAAGLRYTGVDLTPESVAYCRGLGLQAEVASALDLPFPDGTFEAAWTMSTLMHLAPDDQARAVAELARVLRSGSPLAVGVWGSPAPDERTHTNEFGDRYFATTDDDHRRTMLSAVGTVERFETWPDDRSDRHYQWAVVRIH